MLPTQLSFDKSEILLQLLINLIQLRHYTGTHCFKCSNADHGNKSDDQAVLCETLTSFLIFKPSNCVVHSILLSKRNWPTLQN